MLCHYYLLILDLEAQNDTPTPLNFRGVYFRGKGRERHVGFGINFIKISVKAPKKPKTCLGEERKEVERKELEKSDYENSEESA